MISIRFSLILFFLLWMGTLSGQRKIIPLDDNWNFLPEKVEPKDIRIGFWETVKTPHSYSDKLSEAGTYWRKLDFRESSLRRTFIRFESISGHADIYLNGELIGQNSGSLNACCFEITWNLRPKGNRLVVIVKNKNSFTGISGPVSLIMTDIICIAPLNFASSGIYAKQSEISSETATLDIITKIHNGYASNENIQVKVSLSDDKNKEAASAIEDLQMSPGEVGTVRQQLIIQKPTLWQGTDNPYCYHLNVAIIYRSKTVDAISFPIGLRDIQITNNGFLLNGQPYLIKGVNTFTDREGKGPAATVSELEQDVDLILEMGANAIRIHTPYPDYFYSLCDRKGLLVWEESDLSEIENPENWHFTKRRLEEAVFQRYNHSSIFSRGIFSEYTPINEKTLPLIKELNDLVHLTDSTKFTIGTSNEEFLINDFFDYPAYSIPWNENRNELTEIKSFLKAGEGKPICIGSYGANAQISYNLPSTNTNKIADTPEYGSEERQSNIHEKIYREIRKSPSVWGSFIGNMFDSVLPGNNNTDEINRTGLVTNDRQIKKDAFFFYKANWSPEPFAYITSRRDSCQSEKKTDIKVFSNCDELKLIINGVVKEKKRNQGGIFLWKNISLEPGNNLIYVTDDKGISDQCIRELKF